MTARKIRVALALLLAVSFVFTLSVTDASAGDKGLYLRGSTGWSWAGDADFTEDNANTVSTDPEPCFLFVVYDDTGAGNYVCGDTLNELGSSFLFGGGVGYRYNQNIRTDLTVTYRGSYELDEADDAGTAYEADLTSLAFMLNGYYDIPVNVDRITPFVGAGIGFAKNKLNDLEWNDGVDAGKIDGGEWSGFAWQVMAGASIAVTDGVAIETGYRYFDGGDIERDSEPDNGFGWATTSATGELTAHEFFVDVIFALDILN